MKDFTNYVQQIEYTCPWQEKTQMQCEYNIYVNGGIALRLLTNEFGYLEPFAMASVCVPGLQPDEIAIKNYSENEGMLEQLLKNKVITPPHRYVRNDFVTIPVCRLREVTKAA